MGSTMRCAIKLCKQKNASKTVIAVPVTGIETEKQIAKMVDEIIVLEKPLFFRAVAQVYENWYDVSDEEVIEILEKWEKERLNLNNNKNRIL
jgi:putative phosphoribosyl transferase